MRKKLYYVDGLKGIACFGVFVHHFLLAFYPGCYFGKRVVGHMGGNLEETISQSPFSVLIVGNFMVCLFLLVSSFLLSRQLLVHNSKEYATQMSLKRYPRLMIPVTVVCFAVLLLSEYELFRNHQVANITGSPWLQGLYTEKLTVLNFFMNSFVTIWLDGDAHFSTAFWMMNYLFIGSFIALGMVMLYKNTNKRSWMILVAVAIGFILCNSMFSLSVLGVLLALYEQGEIQIPLRFKPIISMVFIVAGLFLGGYPSEEGATNIYGHMNVLPDFMNRVMFYHVMGALLLFLGILLWEIPQKVISLKIFQKMGKISFAVYLLHIPLICWFSSALFERIVPQMDKYSYAVGLTFLATTVLMILLSFLFERYVERYSGKLVEKIVNFFTVRQ